MEKGKECCCHKTKEMCIRDRGSRELPVVVDERIKEIGFGVLEGADFTKIRGDKTSKFTAFFNAPECYEAPEGGESIQQVCDRAEAFLREIIAKHEKDERVMICLLYTSRCV